GLRGGDEARRPVGGADDAGARGRSADAGLLRQRGEAVPDRCAGLPRARGGAPVREDAPAGGTWRGGRVRVARRARDPGRRGAGLAPQGPWSVASRGGLGSRLRRLVHRLRPWAPYARLHGRVLGGARRLRVLGP